LGLLCSGRPVAGPAVFVFSTFLQKSPANSNWNNSWRVLLQRTADGGIAASWFMDAENIRCAVTSVAAQQWYNAQPEAVSGACRVFFKVNEHVCPDAALLLSCCVTYVSLSLGLLTTSM
jgi:hypothetical protein